MRSLRNLREDRKGIDTILAALLMVVIVVVASVMVYAWTTGLFSSLLVKPSAGSEILSMEQPTFASNGTALTLYIRNTGSVSVTLVAYYVKDSTGDQYARSSWTGPTIGPSVLNPTGIGINTSCPSGCVLTGSAFTFSGGQYTVTVVTAKGTQFQWTVNK